MKQINFLSDRSRWSNTVSERVSRVVKSAPSVMRDYKLRPIVTLSPMRVKRKCDGEINRLACVYVCLCSCKSWPRRKEDPLSILTVPARTEQPTNRKVRFSLGTIDRFRPRRSGEDASTPSATTHTLFAHFHASSEPTLILVC